MLVQCRAGAQGIGKGVLLAGLASQAVASPQNRSRRGSRRGGWGLSLEIVVQGLAAPTGALLYLAALMLVLDLVVVGPALAVFDRERLLRASG